MQSGWFLMAMVVVGLTLGYGLAGLEQQRLDTWRATMDCRQ